MNRKEENPIIEQLSTMGFDDGRKYLEDIGYRLTSQTEVKEHGITCVRAIFRSLTGSIFFTHSYKEKWNGDLTNESIKWEYKVH